MRVAVHSAIGRSRDDLRGNHFFVVVDFVCLAALAWLLAQRHRIGQPYRRRVEIAGGISIACACFSLFCFVMASR